MRDKKIRRVSKVKKVLKKLINCQSTAEERNLRKGERENEKTNEFRCK